MKTKNFSRFLWTVIGSAVGLLAPGAQAAFPDKPITIIVSDQAGGPSDLIARSIAQQVSESTKQSVIIENRPGAFGSLGLRAVSAAKPDGYTLGMVFMPHTVSQTLFKATPYQMRKDFTPLAKVADLFNVLIVNKDISAKTPMELAALIKSLPQQMTFGSGSTGSPAHLSGELFKRQAGLDVQHVPFKGPVDALTNVIGGRVDFMFLSLPVAMPMIKSGKVKALAVTSTQVAPAMPNLPTMAQSGFPDFAVLDWMGVVAPAGLPIDVANRLTEEIRKAVESKAYSERLSPFGFSPAYANGSELGVLIDREITKWDSFIKQVGITLE